MVGAGGIGCELLKNLVLSGFSQIEVVDLDTIDLSNLNRQFLFQRKHIGKSKAEVAKETALLFNPNVNITAYHDSIYEPQFSLPWFKRFDLVLNALDNLAARRHVNAMCLAAGIPLVESGTEGFKGQVTLHIKGQTRCYDCDGKPSRKTYPVCTIRSTPSAPIHCIVWAKSYLFSLLFGKNEEDDTINVEEASSNASEMAHLKRESEALKQLREAAGTAEYGRKVFEKVFTDDIKGLVALEDLWKSRAPPTPLDYDALTAGLADNTHDLPEHQVWTIEENVRTFLHSLSILTDRIMSQRTTDPEASLEFDKDDDAALQFVTATSNLRSHVYGLELKSQFAVKEMAGNIIPAVATTNAIIAGLIVLVAFKVLAGQIKDCRNAWVGRTINPERLDPPNPSCSVCTTSSFLLEVDTEKTTLRTIVEDVITKGDRSGDETTGLAIRGDIAVQEGERLLYDVDFDDNLDLPLSQLGIHDSTRLMITNDDDDSATPENVIIILHIQNR
ncbi:hypothetical protein DFS34DRAFT_642694 [Phlyctochytrium arcticum]|nr:hypothetical protein DFS34DRAFT_642694 [Phlyctochytrium arcticum]